MLGAGLLLPQSLQQVTTKASRCKLPYIINLIQETLKRPYMHFNLYGPIYHISALEPLQTENKTSVQICFYFASVMLPV